MKFVSDRDTSPLLPEELSDDELLAFIEIENRIRAATILTGDRGNHPKVWDCHQPEDRYARILLLDGGRGVGKTSLLLTLWRRWNLRHSDSDLALRKQYEKRFQELGKTSKSNWVYRKEDVQSPAASVIRILDFDPLPPQMPLVAGLVQAWRPLVEHYDSEAELSRALDNGQETLLDRFHILFRVATLGWTAISPHEGIVEHVLDRDEQVKDWLQLDYQWRKFIDEMIKADVRSPNETQSTTQPIYVVMIDDLDLQVDRIRELLPALRLLYHPSVFFIVAADRRHLIDMLKLDFVGRQNKLSLHRNAKSDDALVIADTDRWAAELAQSLFEKVFPRRNRWVLNWLSLLEFLNFPRFEDRNFAKFGITLNERKPEPKPSPKGILIKPEKKPMGTYLKEFAELTEELPISLPRVMSYRTAQQILQEISQSKNNSKSATTILLRLLGGRDDHQAVVLPQAVKQPVVSFQPTGELAALYRPHLSETAAGHEFMLSARPDFVYRRNLAADPIRVMQGRVPGFDLTSALLAITLGESGYGVDASGLRWETYLSLAWTNWSLPTGEAAFRWPTHIHPTPKELFRWTREWSEFIATFGDETGEKIDRFAYGWIYYQMKWLGDENRLQPPTLEHATGKIPWEALKKHKPTFDKDGTFWTRTLPLYARPEVGFTPDVQRVLLARVTKHTDKDWLRKQRRRLVADAFVAAAAGRGRRDETAEDKKRAEETIRVIDELYEQAHGRRSPWREIENPRLRINGRTGRKK